MAQYSALRCVSGIWQNSEKPLISNGLRFIFTCLLTGALWVLFHQRRKTFASTILLNNDVPIEIVSKLLGHSSIRVTEAAYAQVMNKNTSRHMNQLKQKLYTEEN